LARNAEWLDSIALIPTVIAHFHLGRPNSSPRDASIESLIPELSWQALLTASGGSFQRLAALATHRSVRRCPA